jgi:cytochrome c oxidase subunit 2
MPVRSPDPVDWWSVPIGKQEKIWLSLVVVTGVSLFAMMILWHVVGAQNSPTETYRVSPETFFQKAVDFNAAAGPLSERTGTGVKPRGDDVYLAAMRYAWVPNTIVLERGRPYRIHLSSRDVNHGFSIHKNGDPAQKANFQAVPGYEYVLTMTFDETGVYDIVCQEYCGIGHQVMVGKFVVE